MLAETIAPPLLDTSELPDMDFLRFKFAARLVGAAVEDAEGWRDVTIHLENSFTNPLYAESRVDFSNALSEALATGIETALA